MKPHLNKIRGWLQRIFTPTVKERGYPLLLMTDAVAFHKAGTSLNSLNGAFGPKNFLLCHSVELAMKAYLTATGSTLADVTNLRHDLKKLRKRCHKRGLTLTHPRTNQILGMIAPVHKKHLLKYMGPGGIMMPSDAEFDGFVSSLLADVWPAIHTAEPSPVGVGLKAKK